MFTGLKKYLLKFFAEIVFQEQKRKSRESIKLRFCVIHGENLVFETITSLGYIKTSEGSCR